MEATAVKERSIIFSGPLVRAILAGMKTQTRRVVKHHLPTGACDIRDIGTGPEIYGAGGVWMTLPCPYEPGTRLWVRETWQPHREGCEKHIRYKADQSFREVGPDAREWDLLQRIQEDCWRSPVTMPRWASRLTLEITDVRVQRLSEISTDDVNAEGVACSDCWTSGTAYTDFPHNEQCGCVNKFRNLWDSENTKSGDTWDANPWVWAITFKRCD